MTEAKLYTKFLETIPFNQLNIETRLEIAEVEEFERSEASKVNGDIINEENDLC